MTCEACGHEQDRGRFCGRCGARVETGEAVAASEVVAAPRRARPQRGWALAAVALVGAGVLLASLAGGRSSEEVVASPQGPPDRSAVRASPAPASSPTSDVLEGRPLFSEPTGLVLLFDDGGTGALALDLDSGAADMIELPGQRVGDQPFRLWPLGGRIVVGWDEVVSLAPGTFLPARTLAEDAVFLPAADPEQLWLIDLPGLTDETVWRLIGLDGDIVAELPALPGDEPVRGVPGGLAVRDEDGRLWRYDLRTRRVLLAAEPPAWIGDASRERVVSCEGEPCRELTVAGVDGENLAISGGGAVFSEAAVWLAPSGEQLAAVVMVDVGGGVDRRLRVYDVDEGILLADAAMPLGEVHGAWSPDLEQFLAWTSLPGGGTDAPARLSRWAGRSDIEQVDVRSLAGRTLGGFVPLFRHRAPTLVEGCPVSPASTEMGPLPAWQGEHVHVALPRSAPDDDPSQLWVGIPGAGDTVVTVSARRTDGSAEAEFRHDAGSEWQAEFTLRGGRRTAAGWPPHWAVESRFPSRGCWVVSVLTGDIADTVTIDLG